MDSVGTLSSSEGSGNFRLSSFETHHRCPRTGRMLKYVTEVLTGPRAAWSERPESRDPEWMLAAPAEIEAIEPGEIAAIRWTGPIDELSGTMSGKAVESTSLLSSMPEASASV